MFIKKDLRKIPKILEDAIVVDDDNDNDPTQSTNDEMLRQAKRSKVQAPLSELRLGRRQQEFQGSIQILCQPTYLPKLTCLQNLNLYDCAIKSLEGIGMFQACPRLEILNLGRNPLQTLPDELSCLKIKELWLDDCQLTGPLPDCVTRLPNLERLRVPHNQITRVPDSINHMKHLQVLCLDRNPIVLPDDLSGLRQLQELFLRHCNLTKLPQKLPSQSLQILHLSSNPLTSVDGLVENNSLSELTQLYINACQLTHLPDGIVSQHPKLQRLVLSHNPRLMYAPQDMWDAVVAADSGSGSMMDIVVWQPNPQLKLGVTEPPDAASTQEEESSDDDDGAAMEGVEFSKE